MLPSGVAATCRSRGVHTCRKKPSARVRHPRVGSREYTSSEMNMFSATLPQGAPLSANGWMLTPEAKDPSRPALLVGKAQSHSWDGKGGRQIRGSHLKEETAGAPSCLCSDYQRSGYEGARIVL
jgi:hypothetical protein